MSRNFKNGKLKTYHNVDREFAITYIYSVLFP